MTAEERLHKLYKRAEKVRALHCYCEGVEITKRAEDIDLIADLVVERMEKQRKPYGSP